MNAASPNPHQPPFSLEQSLAALDDELANAEKHVAALSKAIKRLRKTAREGTVAVLPAGITAAQDDLARAGESFLQRRQADRL